MPSRARCHLCPLDARRAPRWQVAQLPTDELHALLEAVQPLLKPSRKAKAPPAKSGGAGASSSKRKRRSKGDDSSEEEAREEEAPEEEPADSSTADADDGRAFEGALLTLNVLTLPQIPRELFIDESLEGVLQVSAPARALEPPHPRTARVHTACRAARHSCQPCIPRFCAHCV